MKWIIDDKGSSLYTTKYFINYGILKNIQNLLFGVLIIWGLDYRLFLFSPLEFFFVISEFYSFVTKFEKKKSYWNWKMKMNQVWITNWNFQQNIVDSLPWTPSHFFLFIGIHITTLHFSQLKRHSGKTIPSPSPEP